MSGSSIISNSTSKSSSEPPDRMRSLKINDRKASNCFCSSGKCKFPRRLLSEEDLRELLFVGNQNLIGNSSREPTSEEWRQFYQFPRLHLSTTANENKLSPFVLQPSLFHRNRLSPTVYFCVDLDQDSKPPIGLPKDLQCYFRWKVSSITPNSIRNCIAFMKFETIRPSNTTDTFYLGSWHKHMLTAEFSELEEWRKVNHYPGSFHLGRKDKLWHRLRIATQKYGSDKFGNFHPITFVLPKDYKSLGDFWSRSSNKLFIMKPPASARGNGIKVINDISQIPTSAVDSLRKSTMIVQQYIANPCLLENGHKFDLRIYVLLTSVDPLRVYVYDEGLVRFASTKYTCQEDGIVDQYMHLTNYFVNKNNQDYQVNNDCDSLNGCKWTLKRFWRYLMEHHSHIDTQQLWNKIIDVIVKTIVCCEGPITRLSQQNCKNDYTSYELFGFDILLDENFKPWILEVNITPSLRSESNLDTSVKYGVIRDMFNTIGYNIPPMPNDEMPQLENCRLFFDSRMYKEVLTKRDKLKHLKYTKLFKVERDESFNDRILEDLTQNDIRILMLTEDEFTRCGHFKRVFPSAESHKYLEYFDKSRYYNLLLNAWECKYKDNRLEGIAKLSSLAKFMD